jgi:hypothetical protein
MLAQGGALKIRCDACGHAATWTRDEAIARLGPGASPYEVRRKLLCGRCGTAGWVSVWI